MSKSYFCSDLSAPPQSTNYLTLSRSSSPTAPQKKAGPTSRSTTPTSPMFAKLFSARLADYARAEGGEWSQRSSVVALDEPQQRLPVSSPCSSPAIRQRVSSDCQRENISYFYQLAIQTLGQTDTSNKENFERKLLLP